MGQFEAEVRLPPGVRAVAAARAELSRVLAGWGVRNAELLHSSALVVTELVANAVRHAGGLQRLVISADYDSITLAVDDLSPTLPRFMPPSEAGGRGLLIVNALSVSCGFLKHAGDGKRVWARLARPTAGDQRSS
jgi:anti-sigma regulatory factor (Ser/Thr protein kinase)